MCALVAIATGACAMINPTFTPVQLVSESQTILRWKAKPSEDFAKIEMTLEAAMKQDPAAEWKDKALTVLVTDESLANGLKEEVFFGEVSTVDALAFLNRKKDGKVSGVIRVGDKWFGLLPGDGGKWNLTQDDLDMKAVWDGECRMLAACVDYLLKTPGADVPVRMGASWATKKQVGTIAGKDVRIAVLPVAGKPLPQVSVVSDTSTFIFAYDPAKKEYAGFPSDLRFRAPLATEPPATFKFDESARNPSCVGAARPPVVADFDGDFLPDVLVPFEEGALFYKGAADGSFAAPKPVGKVTTGKGAAVALPADFDGDGRLDLLVLGKQGHFLWMNMGGGQFEGNFHHGEPDYIAKEKCSSGAVGDMNGDGRMDFVICYENSGPHFFFSRGFATFGFAAEMDVIKSGMFAEAAQGQQAAQFADLNGDGAEDCVMVLKDGTVWVLERSAPTGPALSLRAELKPDVTGVVRLEAYDGARLLGARQLAPGSPVYLSRKEPGPIRLKWRFPKGEVQEKEVLLIDAPVRLSLGPDGAQESQ